MSLSIITQESKNNEEQVQNKIFNSIDKSENIIFNAGAGAGKTYALIESLRYIINKYGRALKKNNQKVMCITYTNVAVDEIKDRLGSSEIVAVSTIHEKLWGLINQFQKELLIIHKNKLKNELLTLTDNLNEDENMEVNFRAYRNLTPDLKRSFTSIMLSKKDLFYKNYDRNATSFRNTFANELTHFENIISNVSNFKKTVNTLYKINNYTHCLNKIEEGDNNYKNVYYESKYNNDILHKMLISHDTLLYYSYIIIEKYDLLKQIIIDSHPFILIDEYQDTNPLVVKILKSLSNHSKKINHSLFLGYFGDVLQNIYDDGVGNKINSLHEGLKDITKHYNRRSNIEIINAINKIRDDEIQQTSIYQDCEGGSVQFCYSQTEDKLPKINSFIKKHVREWNISGENKLHCLVLTNRLVAELSGFKNIYQLISTSKYYRKNYKYINTELLSSDLSKLGSVPKVIYNVLKLKNSLENPKTPLTSLLENDIYSQLSFLELKALIIQLKSINGDNLYLYLQSMFNVFEQGDKNVKNIISDIVEIEEYTFSAFLNYILENLSPNLNYDDDAEYQQEKNKTENLLKVDFKEYNQWFNFITNNQNSDVIFHTYHGTKGLEFDNVVIIMENNFGLDSNKFSSYFSNVINPEVLEVQMRKKFENTKNLLYVSCSRARRNLRILYLDNIESFTNGIEYIFDNASEYSVENT